MTPEAATKSPSVSTEVATAALKRYSDAVDSLRQRADLAAKVLAGAGSTLITAIGIAKFSDLYPVPPDPTRVSWLQQLPFLDEFSGVGLSITGVIGGFVFMIAAIMAIAYRYWKVAESIQLRSDLARVDLKKPSELALVKETYHEVATLNDVDSLNAYEARAHRLERIAKWLPGDDAERALAQATLIQTEVLATQTRARLRVLRGRVVNAVRGRVSVLLYLLFVLGVILFGLGTDYLASKRTDEITVAKACADARAVDSSLALPPICGSATDDPGDDALETPSQVATARLALAISLQECLTAVADDDSLDAAACNQLADAISSLGP